MNLALSLMCCVARLMTGPVPSVDPLPIRWFDCDHDGDLDLRDVAAFQNSLPVVGEDWTVCR